jgi:predicted nuclease of predicted toxin-antitoxin system
MKLLFDENLSFKLPRILSSDFPGSRHVRNCGLKGSPDEDIWEYAKINSFIIISKDADFYQRSLLYGAPPKLVWLRIGNCTRDVLVSLILQYKEDIYQLHNNLDDSILVILPI